jgi:hypothetical protein
VQTVQCKPWAALHRRFEAGIAHVDGRKGYIWAEDIPHKVDSFQPIVDPCVVGVLPIYLAIHTISFLSNADLVRHNDGNTLAIYIV